MVEDFGQDLARAVALVARDECALALLARQDPGVDQGADTGAHRVNRDPEAFREFGFSRQLLARFPLAVRETLQHVALDLLVQRLRRAQCKRRLDSAFTHNVRAREK